VRNVCSLCGATAALRDARMPVTRLPTDGPLATLRGDRTGVPP
jgi:hypothetical protein